MGFIYIATNKLNGKKYVGKTERTFKERLKDHLKKKTKRKETIFHKALHKYGIENFSFEILEVPNEELNTKEIKLIKELKTLNPDGYNLTEGGEGAVGYRHTEENKIKFGNMSRGKKLSEEARRKISLSKIGIKRSEELKRHLSEVKMGKKLGPFTEEHKRKMSISGKMAHLKREYRKFIFISPEGKEFYCETNFRDFCRSLNLTTRLMYKVLKGELPHHKKWKIKEIKHD